MKNTLQAIYLKIDTTSKSLAKSALAQLILKILFYYDKGISTEEIKSEVNSLLKANLKRQRIEDAITLLIQEEKIIEEDHNYLLTKNRKQKIDVAYQEYTNRISRIIDKYFSPVKSKKEAVRNWFETITIQFFTEYKSEWIAEKAYKTKKENSYEGLKNIIDLATKKDRNIEEEDKEWLKKQYSKFFHSSEDDLISIFWDYGTCAFSSALITAHTSVDQLTLESFRNSKFILDTNVLMYLHLEEGIFYDSYKALEKIFIALNITPCIFNITKEEYKKTIGNKRDEVLRIIEKYDEDVVDKLDDAFIKTAKSRQCESLEDFERFFDELIDPPEIFVDEVKIKVYDNPSLDSNITAGQENETLVSKLNEIYKNRHKYKGFNSSNKSTKDKRRRPLMHDAGLISGAEYLRNSESCFVLSRDITVKQYGIETVLRDEPAISIGLDSLISIFALDNGGIDIDPTNFKPLFANIIKLALIPERDTFQLADLARMLDVEEQIAQLPTESIIEIAEEVNKNKLIGLDDEKITVQLIRSFQNHKMQLKEDLETVKKEKLIEKGEKERYKSISEKAEDALQQKYYEEFRERYDRNLRRNKILFYFIFPIATIALTILTIYLITKEGSFSWVTHIIGFTINLLAWVITSVFVVKPRLIRTYTSSVSQINEEVDKKIKEITGG